MGIEISILMACAAITLFVMAFLLSRLNYERRFSSKFSLKNMFPFEFNYEGKFTDNFIPNVLLSLAFLVLIAFYGTFDGLHTDGIAIFVLISGIISSILGYVLFFVPFRHLKTHIALSTFMFVFSFMLTGSTFLLNMFYFRQYENAINLVTMIFSGILALSVLLMVLNPKLSLRIEGREEKLPNGEVIMHRPKWIMIAVTEWVSIFAIILNQIGVILYLSSLK